MRVWAGIEDDDSHSFCAAEEKANAIVQHVRTSFMEDTFVYKFFLLNLVNTSLNLGGQNVCQH